MIILNSWICHFVEIIQKYIPSGVGWVVAVDEALVFVDEVAVDETVEVSAVDKVVVDEVAAVDGSFGAAAEREKIGIILYRWSCLFV